MLTIFFRSQLALSLSLCVYIALPDSDWHFFRLHAISPSPNVMNVVDDFVQVMPAWCWTNMNGMLNDDRTHQNTNFHTPRPSLRCQEFLRANDQIRVPWSLAEIRQDAAKTAWLRVGSIRVIIFQPRSVFVGCNWRLRCLSGCWSRFRAWLCLGLFLAANGHFALLAGCVAGLANSCARMEAKCKGSCSTCTTVLQCYFANLCNTPLPIAFDQKARRTSWLLGEHVTNSPHFHCLYSFWFVWLWRPFESRVRDVPWQTPPEAVDLHSDTTTASFTLFHTFTMFYHSRIRMAENNWRLCIQMYPACSDWTDPELCIMWRPCRIPCYHDPEGKIGHLVLKWPCRA